jgi:two-component system phosphate regulon sensor histidine kinase PhoR
MKQEAADELEYIHAGIEAAGTAYLDVLRRSPLRLTLFGTDGTVLYDNESDPARMENHSDRPEIQAALAGSIGESTRFSGTLEKQTYYRAIRLTDGKILRIALTTDSILSSALTLVPLTLIIVLVVFVCAFLTASRITERIVKPINQLNLEKPEDNIIYDEFSPLLFRIKKQKDQIEKQMTELRKKQLEFQAIMDNMREGLLLLDREGRILSCNQSALKLLRTHSAILENQNALVLRRDEPFRYALGKALNGTPAETSLATDTSRLRLMASPVMDSGNVQGAALLLLDVTEQEDREKLRRDFSANVSHELKTPLTIISGYAEILSGGLVKPEDAPEFAAKIYKEVQGLVTLIDDIVQLSRLDEGGGELKREDVNLLALAGEVAESAGPTAEARKIRITVEGEDAVISGVPRILREVLFNLLDNGIKYNKANGEVRISVKRERNKIRLSVADTGIGIPAAEQDRVFERFYRVDKSRNGQTGGTGLGLSIVKHGAQLHHARIDLKSSGSSGTTITLIFEDNADKL